MACFHEEPIDFTSYSVITCVLTVFSVLENRQKVFYFDTKRTQIVVLSEERYFEQEIRAKMHCSKSAAHTALEIFNN